MAAALAYCTITCHKYSNIFDEYRQIDRSTRQKGSIKCWKKSLKWKKERRRIKSKYVVYGRMNAYRRLEITTFFGAKFLSAFSEDATFTLQLHRNRPWLLSMEVVVFFFYSPEIILVPDATLRLEEWIIVRCSTKNEEKSMHLDVSADRRQSQSKSQVDFRHTNDFLTAYFAIESNATMMN